jgi:hypothetical protein
MNRGHTPQSLKYSMIQNSLAHYNQILGIRPSINNRIHKDR